MHYYDLFLFHVPSVMPVSIYIPLFYSVDNGTDESNDMTP
jgi:hypothetical protein